MNYLKLAKEQFDNLKEETLDDDRSCVGAGNEEEYDKEGVKFRIKVDGCWETSTWFNWVVYNEKGEEIEKGTEYD